MTQSEHDDSVIDCAIVPAGQQTQTGLAVLGSAVEMAEKLEETDKKRTVVHDYIKRNFRPGVDFGSADQRNPKPTLLKPGAEKVCGLFATRPTWRRDDDTWEMLGKPVGTVCYICEIISNETGAIVGEGRGAEKVGNKGRDANKAIKAAEKCALVDAALYTFNLSEIFTQEEGGPDSVAAGMDLNAQKQALIDAVDLWRRGCESPLSTIQFLVIVIESELHRKQVKSIGEIDHIRKVLLVDKLYDPATADKFPEGTGAEE